MADRGDGVTSRPDLIHFGDTFIRHGHFGVLILLIDGKLKLDVLVLFDVPGSLIEALCRHRWLPFFCRFYQDKRRQLADRGDGVTSRPDLIHFGDTFSRNYGVLILLIDGKLKFDVLVVFGFFQHL